MEVAMPVYWIDAGVLITAKNGVLDFELSPKFWIFIDQHVESGQVRMPRLAGIPAL